MSRIVRKIVSDRGSVFAEYAMLTAAVTLVAISAFAPNSVINKAIGCDYFLREIFIKMPWL